MREIFLMSRRPLFFIIAIFAVSLVLTSCTGLLIGHNRSISPEKTTLRIMLSEGSSAREAAYTKDDVTSFRVTILSADRNSAVIPAEDVTPGADGACTYEKEIAPGTYSVYVQAIISGSANWTAYKAPSFYGITENQQIVASKTPTTVSVNMVPLTISGSATGNADSADWDKGIIPQALPASNALLYFWDSTSNARQLMTRLPATTNGTGFTLYADTGMVFYLNDAGTEVTTDADGLITNNVGCSPDKPMKATDDANLAIYSYCYYHQDVPVVVNLLGDVTMTDWVFSLPLTINGNGHTIKADPDYNNTYIICFDDENAEEVDGNLVFSGTYFIYDTIFDGGLTFDEGEPEYGNYIGGINAYADIVLDHCTIQNCSKAPVSYTTNGFTYWSKSEGAGIISYGTLTMTDCTIKNCYIDQEGECSEGYGAGIAVITYDESDNPSKATLTRCTIENCKSCGFGGGLYISENGTEVILNDCTFTKCKADDNGGGIYMKGTLNLQGNNNISYCSAGTSGGGLYLNTTNVTFADDCLCTFDHCSAASGGGLGAAQFGGFKNCSFTNCIATDLGGGAYIFSLNSDFYNPAHIEKCTFTHCSATTGGAWFGSSDGAYFAIDDCQISGCSAKDGGALANSGRLDLSNTTITGCTAGGSGGALYINNDSNQTRTVTISGCTISGCQQKGSSDHGGGIYDYDAQLTITGTSITSCTDASGIINSIYCKGSNASLTIDGNSLCQNASSGYNLNSNITPSGT